MINDQLHTQHILIHYHTRHTHASARGVKQTHVWPHVQTHTHTRDILFHYGRRAHWGQSGVGRQKGERETGRRKRWMDGCCINTEPNTQLQTHFSCSNFSHTSSFTKLLPVPFGTSCFSDPLWSLEQQTLSNTWPPLRLPPSRPVSVSCCSGYLKYWSSLSSGQSEQTRVP